MAASHRRRLVVNAGWRGRTTLASWAAILSSPQEVSPPSRSAALDAARALAVLAMVLGHTADALLSTAARATPLFATYSTFRGMTAPLFFFVSGWAIATRGQRQPLGPREVLRLHGLRALFLVAMSLVLRWPSYDVWGLLRLQPDVWRHWLGSDALVCIATALVLAGVVFAAPLGATGRLVIFAVLASVAPFLAQAVGPHPPSGFLGEWLTMTQENPFPVVPWTGHFFAGGAVALSIAAVKDNRRRPLVFLLPSAVGSAAALLLGLDGLPLWSPTLYLYRLSFALGVGGVLSALPDRWLRVSRPLGQASLVTYVFHLPALYGWGRFPGLGRTLGAVLSPTQVVLLSAIFVTCGTLAAGLWRTFRRARYRPARTDGAGRSRASLSERPRHSRNRDVFLGAEHGDVGNRREPHARHR